MKNTHYVTIIGIGRDKEDKLQILTDYQRVFQTLSHAEQLEFAHKLNLISKIIKDDVRIHEFLNKR